MSPTKNFEISPSELEARLRLHRLPEVGPKRFRLLIEAFGSASRALSAPASAWRSLGLPAISAEARRSPEVRDGASVALAWLEQPAQHLRMWDEPDYPALLAQIDDAPPLLFVAGDPALLEKPQLAMVGSRRASRPGMDTAAAFSRSLASAGFVITSGLALGIDGAAHQAALEVGGQTIGVLGTGLQNFYPQRHKKLAAAMIAQGSAVVSEFPLDAAPQAGNFPRRNRIIIRWYICPSDFRSHPDANRLRLHTLFPSRPADGRQRKPSVHSPRTLRAHNRHRNCRSGLRPRQIGVPWR
ncbi:DNA-processing protein DprA [Pseudomonas extremaustralis]